MNDEDCTSRSDTLPRSIEAVSRHLGDLFKINVGLATWSLLPVSNVLITSMESFHLFTFDSVQCFDDV